MFRVLLLLLIVTSTSACAQVHEILVTDTAHVDSWFLEDSIEYFSFASSNKLNGHWVVFHDKSRQHKVLEATFKKGKLMGTEKQWYADAKLLSEKKCVNDTCTIDYFYQSGALMRRDIEAINSASGSRTWFYSVTYCDNGQIKYSPPLNPDSKTAQFVTSYYCSGAKKEEYTLIVVDGKHLKIRNYNEWFENGNPKTIGYYEDEITGPGEKKTGDWNYYNAEGKLIRQEKYENGELQETMQY